MLSRMIRNIGMVILMAGLCMADSSDLIYPFSFIAVGALMMIVGERLEADE